MLEVSTDCLWRHQRFFPQSFGRLIPEALCSPLNDVTDRLKSAISVWRTAAPDAVFAGMTLAEFEEANEAPLRLRIEIEKISLDLIARKAKRADGDRETRALLQMLANSVKSTPGYGPNSPIYGALGYV